MSLNLFSYPPGVGPAELDGQKASRSPMCNRQVNQLKKL